MTDAIQNKLCLRDQCSNAEGGTTQDGDRAPERDGRRVLYLRVRPESGSTWFAQPGTPAARWLTRQRNPPHTGAGTHASAIASRGVAFGQERSPSVRASFAASF